MLTNHRNNTSKHIVMDGPSNFRDLGGIITVDERIISRGMIFRADRLAELSPGDIQILKDLQIRTVVDFRSTGEMQAEPDTLPGELHLDYLHLPMGIDQGKSAEWTNTLRSMTPEQATDLIVGYYAKLPLEWPGQYRAFFHKLLDIDALPLVFHCTAGKDRTGIATALLLHILGVDMASNGREYELSNMYRTDSHEKYAGLFRQHGIDSVIGSILMEVKKEYLEKIFETVAGAYGSMDNYIERALDLNGNARARLKQIFLE